VVVAVCLVFAGMFAKCSAAPVGVGRGTVVLGPAKRHIQYLASLLVLDEGAYFPILQQPVAMPQVALLSYAVPQPMVHGRNLHMCMCVYGLVVL
jgi:hypothetical protein